MHRLVFPSDIAYFHHDFLAPVSSRNIVLRLIEFCCWGRAGWDTIVQVDVSYWEAEGWNRLSAVAPDTSKNCQETRIEGYKSVSKSTYVENEDQQHVAVVWHSEAHWKKERTSSYSTIHSLVFALCIKWNPAPDVEVLLRAQTVMSGHDILLSSASLCTLSISQS